MNGWRVIVMKMRMRRINLLKSHCEVWGTIRMDWIDQVLGLGRYLLSLAEWLIRINNDLTRDRQTPTPRLEIPISIEIEIGCRWLLLDLSMSRDLVKVEPHLQISNSSRSYNNASNSSSD
jgi:hypothetical protein